MVNSILHTDALEQKYGPITAIVVRHDPAGKTTGERMRKAKLVDQCGIVRTYALTFLKEYPESKELDEIEGKIQKGALIGQTFRNYHYDITRIELGSFDIPITDWLKNEFQTSSSVAHATVIDFHVEKTGKGSFTYGTLIEVYCPEFYPPSGLVEKSDDLKPLYRRLIAQLDPVVI
jgi:hypothetical protein